MSYQAHEVRRLTCGGCGRTARVRFPVKPAPGAGDPPCVHCGARSWLALPTLSPPTPEEVAQARAADVSVELGSVPDGSPSWVVQLTLVLPCAMFTDLTEERFREALHGMIHTLRDDGGAGCSGEH